MRKGADYPAICKQFDISPVLARLIRNRGICDQTAIENYLYGSLSMLADPKTLPDIEAATGLLIDAITAGAPIRIIGDYDVDGVCAAYCLKVALTRLGAHADIDIPDRKADGYGINSRLVSKAVQDGIEVIITCDNGISAHEAVQSAIDQGLSVIVTDHHEVSAEPLPPADAVIDPKRADSIYSERDICGAVVAWQTARALYSEAGRAPGELDDLLPFAALATVCDVVPLQGDSRIIVKEGLARMKTTGHIGLSALIKACSIERERLSAYHLGYILGPCINACGRLTSASDAVSLMDESDPVKAEKKAMMIRALNDRRKTLSEEGFEAAVSVAEEAIRRGEKVLVLQVDNCDESIAGIVAGRIKELFYRPTILLTGARDGCVKGSGRSVSGYDLFGALNARPELFERYGGHEQAAGLTIRQERIGELEAALCDPDNAPDDEILVEKLSLDMVLPFARCSEELVDELKKLEPCGMGNRKALFGARHVKVSKVRIMGRERRVLAFEGDDGSGTVMNCVCFGDVQELLDKIREESGVDPVSADQSELEQLRLTLAYTLSINEYNGRRILQAIVGDVLVES